MPSGRRREHAQYVTSLKIYFRPRLTVVASRILKSLMTEVKNCRIQPKKNIYKPLFHQIFKTSKQREHAIQSVLRKYYMLKTYSKPLHLYNYYLHQTFLTFLITINQSTASLVETVQMKGRAKRLPVIRRKV